MIFLLTRLPSPFAVLSLLLICTCAYLHQIFPTILDRNKQGYVRTFGLAGWLVRLRDGATSTLDSPSKSPDLRGKSCTVQLTVDHHIAV